MHVELSADSHIKPLPFCIYYWVVVLLAGSGLTASIYLAISHYWIYTDIGYRSFCAISKAINCDTVSLSPYSIFLNVPVPVWGIIGYSLFLVLTATFAGRCEAKDKYHIWAILFTLAMAFSLYSAVLAFISSYYIGSYCIVCIATYAVNFLLAYFCWLIRKRFDPVRLIHGLQTDVVYLWRKRGGHSLLTAGIFFALTACLLFRFPDYWNLHLPEQANQLSTGYTVDGHPWIGSNSPALVITEYTDYLCFQCKKMHFYLRELMVQHPDKIRLIHRNFPMDSRYNPIVKMPFHEGAGVLAQLALYAGQNEKFWQGNDYIYSTIGRAKQFDLNKMAQAVGLDLHGLRQAGRDPKLRHKVESDIWQGLKLGITGTPAYEINGKVFQGEIPAVLLKSVLQ